MFETLTGLAILFAVLICVVWRPSVRWWPGGLPVYVPAGFGAVLVIVLSLVGLPMLVTIFGRVWDASVTLVGLFMLAAALESNNFFEWAALRLAKMAGGSPWRLYVLMCLLTIGVTVCLGNDGAILGITAIVAKLVKRIFSGKMDVWLPYIFATGFLADAFSGFLVPDNLTNIIVASTYHLPFLLFVSQMALPMIFAAIVAIISFALRFRTVLFKSAVGYEAAYLEPASVLRNKFIFKADCVALVVLIIGHLVLGGILHLPVSVVVMPVALVMLGLAHFGKIGHARDILLAAPWDVLVYALGMFVVITAAMTPAVVNAFLSIGPLHALIVGEKSVSGIFVAGGILAVLAALTNNLPATLVGILLLGTVKHPAMLAIYAVILGVDVGPKLTPYGSLATLMWMGILKKEGVEISWGQCFKENAPVAVFSLGASLCGLLGLMVVGLV